MTIEFWCIAEKDDFSGEIVRPVTGLFPTREAAEAVDVKELVLPEGYRLVICTVTGFTVVEWDFNEV